MAKNFNEFADGGIVKTTDRVVGVRGNAEANFDFPGDGIQDEFGNYYYKYVSDGALSANYLQISNSTTGNPVIIEAGGSDSNQSITIRSISDGGITINSPNLGNINIDTPNSFINMNSTTPIKGVLDEDDMVSDSAVDVPTQQSVKAFMDNQISVITDNYFNGLILETPDITVSSDGATISVSIENGGGGDLNLIFSSGIFLFDSTPAASVNVVSGTDEVFQVNYVYIPLSTKVLTNSTTGFPNEEFVAITTLLCQSAASVQNDGVYKSQRWADDVDDPNLNGHSKHINAWLRHQNAVWISGTDVFPTAGLDAFSIATSSGFVLQVHPCPFPPFDTLTGSHIYMVNDFSTPYKRVTDLRTVLTDASGASMSGRTFNLVMWGTVAEDAVDSQLYWNLPTGSYITEESAIDDTQGYTIFDIPREFKGTAFLICRLTINHDAAGPGTWSVVNQRDLRGLEGAVATSAGGGIAFLEEDPDPVLGGDLKVSTYKIISETPNDLALSAAVGRTLDLQVNGVSIGDITNAGLRLGGANSRVSAILDEDNMVSDSDTALATQQSIKAYVDASGTGSGSFTYLTKLDQTISLPNSEPLAPKATGIMASTTTTGEVDTRILTGTANQINIASGDGAANPTYTLSSTLVFPGTATLGGNLFTNTHQIESLSGNMTLVTDGGSAIYLSTPTVLVDADIAHFGDPDTKVAFGVDAIDLQAGGASRLDVDTTGVRFGGANSRVTTILDEDNMASDSDTALSTQQSIKAYVDTEIAVIDFPWTEVTGTSQSMVANNGYISNNVALVSFSLPVSASIGDRFHIVGKGAGLFAILQNAGQAIHFGNQDTTTGVGGSITATHRYDAIELLCTTANTEFTISSGPQGSFTVV